MKKQIKNSKNSKTKKVISAGVILVCDESDKLKVLLIKNKKSGEWGFPKGHVENKENPNHSSDFLTLQFGFAKLQDKETLIETAKREVKEEVGLKIDFLESKPYFESNYIDDEGNNKRVVYFVKKVNKIKPRLNNEIEDYMWVDLERAYKILVFPELKEIIKSVKELFKGGNFENFSR